LKLGSVEQETDGEAIEVYAGADYWRAEGAPGRCNSGMAVSDARKLKGLEEENAKLMKLLAESMLDMSTLKEMLAKKW
jgi:hypothetical protein